jgi:hypothetical protein
MAYLADTKGVVIKTFTGKDASEFRIFEAKFEAALIKKDLTHGLLSDDERALYEAKHMAAVKAATEAAKEGASWTTVTPKKGVAATPKKSGGGLQRTPSKGGSAVQQATMSGGGALTGGSALDLPEEMDFDWAEINTKVYGMLVDSTDDVALRLVLRFQRTKDGRAAWNALKLKYQRKGTTRRATLMAEISADRIGDEEDPAEYFLRLDHLAGLVEDDGGQEVTEEAKLGYALVALPPAYNMLVPVIDNLPEAEMTYDIVKKKIEVHYEWLVKTGQISKKGKDAALSAQAGGFKGRCHNCGQTGHLKRDCPNPKKGSGDKKETRKCYYCHKVGHIKEDCRKLKREQKEAANLAVESIEVSFMAMEPEPAVDATTSDACLLSSERRKEVASRTSLITAAVDSGCTRTLFKTSEGLFNLKPVQTGIEVANDQTMMATHSGSMTVVFTGAKGERLRATMHDVLVVPELQQNLLSVKKLTQAGASVTFGPDGGVIEIKGVKIPLRRDGGLYKVDATREQALVAVKKLTYADWHRRTGHRNPADIRRMGKMGVGIPEGLSPSGKCDTCEVAKHTHASFPGTAERTKGVLDLVHSDLLQAEVPSKGGANYAIGFTTDRGRWRMVYFMKHKHQALACLQRYVADMKALTGGLKLKRLRSDMGGEYLATQFEDWCKDQGIHHTTSGPHAPQQNGVAERSWRTVTEMTRCLRLDAGLGKEHWAELMNTAVYLINRMPTSSLGGDTPYHDLFGKHADLSHLRSIGCRAYAHVYDHERKKLDDKAWRGILLGYDDSSPSYRIYDPDLGKVRRTVHVTFDEDIFPAKQGQATEAEIPISDEPSTASKAKPDARVAAAPKPTSVGAAGQGETDPESKAECADQPATAQRRGEIEGDEIEGGDSDAAESEAKDEDGEHEAEAEASVGANRPWYWDRPPDGDLPSRASRHNVFCQDSGCKTRGPHLAHLTIEYAYSAAEQIMMDDPTSYEQAMRSPQAVEWKRAMQEEYDALMSAGTWSLVDLPAGANLINGLWVYKAKRNELGEIVRYKARYVADGSKQKFGLDFLETHASVAKFGSVRVVLAVSAVEDWELDNLDFTNAYLQSSMEGAVVYVRQPKGHVIHGADGKVKVCKLHKSLYGLKQAGRNWWMVIDKWLKEYGLTPSPADPCVYVMICAEDTLIIVLYVDDVILAGNSRALMDKFKQAIAKRFDVKDLGALRWILGMEVRRDRSRRTLEIHQTAYVDRVLERFGMTDCADIATPMSGDDLPRLSGDEGAADSRYMSAVGSMLYSGMVTRPDTAFHVQRLGRHMQASDDRHMLAAKRIMRYLKGTRELGIKYSGAGAGKLQLVGYCDADWAGDKETRRSTTAYIFMLAGACVSWASKLQPTVALSSAEAEYMAASSAAQEAIYLRRLLESLGHKQESPTIIYEDNQSCIAMADNPAQSQRIKHIDIKYHFVREKIQSGDIKLVYVQTERQLADLLTKALTREKLQKLRGRVLGYDKA